MSRLYWKLKWWVCSWFSPVHVTDEPIHEAFGLSYASYYVMPRVVLQSMPVDWQRRFIALTEEIYRHLDYEDPDYCVLRCPIDREEYDEEARDMVHCTETCPRYVHDPLSEYRHNRIERRKPAKAGG